MNFKLNLTVGGATTTDDMIGSTAGITEASGMQLYYVCP